MNIRIYKQEEEMNNSKRRKLVFEKHIFFAFLARIYFLAVYYLRRKRPKYIAATLEEFRFHLQNSPKDVKKTLKIHSSD